MITTLCILGVLGFGLGDLTDIVESDDFQTAVDVVDAFRTANREISASEEYYLGRAVAANILESYSPVGGFDFNTYLNSVGGWVAMNSPVPCTYGGWHFQLLSSSEINAMACPGGTILITRGLLDQVRDEDELACVLAHEIAHVCLRHGVGAVQQARWTEAFMVAGMAGAERLGSADVQEAADSYGDIAADITEALVTKGYSREAEREADSLAVLIAASAGYDPHGLERVLERMAAVTARSGPGFWQTHPSPEDRIDGLALGGYGPTPGYEARKTRFIAALASASEPASYGPGTPSSGTATGGRGTTSSGGSSGGTSGGRGGSSGSSGSSGGTSR